MVTKAAKKSATAKKRAKARKPAATRKPRAPAKHTTEAPTLEGVVKAARAAGATVTVSMEPNKAKRERGRPTTYTEQATREILERLSTGEPLAQICRAEHMPAVRTVSQWKKDHPEFLAAFACAREEGADVIAQECLEIADAPGRKLLEAIEAVADAMAEGEGIEEALAALQKFKSDNPDLVQRDRLRVETRLKLLAKWFPAKYGEKLQLADADGKKLEQPPPPQWIIQPVQPKDPEA